MVSTSKATLEIVAKAKDEFSAELRKQLRTLKGDIDRNVSKPSREASKAVRGISTAFKGLVGIVVLRRLSREAFEFAKNLSAVGSEATELQNRIKVSFGDGVGRLREFSEELKATTGRGILDTQETASAFAVLFKGLGTTQEQAQKLSEQATKLTTDFSSFFDLDPTQGRQSLLSGLVGETEVLRRRFNVAVNDQLLKAEALRLGYKELGPALNPAVRAIATLSLAARQQSVAIGDAERTSHEFANTMRNIGSQVRDVRAELGEKFNDELLKLITNLGGVDGVVAAVTVGLEGLQSGLVGAVRFLATDGTQALVGFLQAGKNVIGLLGGDTSGIDAFLEQPLLKVQQLQLEIKELEAVIADGDLLNVTKGGEALFTLTFGTGRAKERLAEARAELAQLEREVPDVAAKMEEAFRTLSPPALDFSQSEIIFPDISTQLAGQLAANPSETLELPNVASLQGIDVIAQAAPDFDILAGSIGGTGSALSELDAIAKEAAQSMQDQAEANLRATQELSGFKTISELTASAQSKFNRTAIEQRDLLREQRDATLAFIESFQKAGATEEQVELATRAANRAFQDQVDQIKNLPPVVDSATDAFLRFGQVAGKAILEANKKIAKSADETNTYGSAIESGLASGFNALAPSISRSTNELQNFTAALLQAIQVAASSELAKNLIGVFSSAIGGAAAGGGDVSFTSDPSGSGFGAGSTNLNVFGKGTPLVDSPELAVVGDVPEAIVPLPDGRSVPVQIRGGGGIGGQGGGSSPAVHFNVSAVDAGGVAAFFAENREAIAEQMIEAYYERSNFRQLFSGGREF